MFSLILLLYLQHTFYHKSALIQSVPQLHDPLLVALCRDFMLRVFYLLCNILCLLPYYCLCHDEISLFWKYIKKMNEGMKLQVKLRGGLCTHSNGEIPEMFQVHVWSQTSKTSLHWERNINAKIHNKNKKKNIQDNWFLWSHGPFWIIWRI